MRILIFMQNVNLDAELDLDVDVVFGVYVDADGDAEAGVDVDVGEGEDVDVLVDANVCCADVVVDVDVDVVMAVGVHADVKVDVNLDVLVDVGADLDEHFHVCVDADVDVDGHANRHGHGHGLLHTVLRRAIRWRSPPPVRKNAWLWLGSGMFGCRRRGCSHTFQNHAEKMISTEGVAQHANAGALRAVSIFLCRRLVDVHSRSRAQKNAQTEWLCSPRTCLALRANVICRGGDFSVQEACACACEAAHRKCCCRVFCSSGSLS